MREITNNNKINDNDNYVWGILNVAIFSANITNGSQLKKNEYEKNLYLIQKQNKLIVFYSIWWIIEIDGCRKCAKVLKGFKKKNERKTQKK